MASRIDALRRVDDRRLHRRRLALRGGRPRGLKPAAPRSAGGFDEAGWGEYDVYDMAAMSQGELASALRERFEADALLGAHWLPVQRAGTTPTKERSEPTVLAAPEVKEEEAAGRRVALEVMDREEVKGCTKCGLSATRTKTVFGVGSPTGRIMFIGEAPGHDEDMSGEPFVGRAGQLLTAMIEKGMGLKREDVYIANVIKCRPPENRTPASDEIAACKDYLWRQIEIIQPQVIIALGAPAAQTLLGVKDGIGRLRGRWHEFHGLCGPLEGEPIPVLPTFHPAYLLRDPSQKAKAWEDLKMVMSRLGLPLPQRSPNGKPG